MNRFVLSLVGVVGVLVLGLEPLLLWASISLLYAPQSFWGVYTAWLFVVFLILLISTAILGYRYLTEEDEPPKQPRRIQRIT